MYVSGWNTFFALSFMQSLKLCNIKIKYSTSTRFQLIVNGVMVDDVE